MPAHVMSSASKEKTEKESLVLINEAIIIADKLKIRKILIVCEKPILVRTIPPDTEKIQFIIVIPHEKVTEENAHEVVLCDFRGVARSDRLDYILRTAIELGRLKKGEKAV